MKPFQQIISRLAAMLLLTVCIMAGKTVDADKSFTHFSNLAELNGGCITSSDQTVYFEYFPETVTASTATGGDCGGSYSYQRQWRTDNFFITKFPALRRNTEAGFRGSQSV